MILEKINKRLRVVLEADEQAPGAPSAPGTPAVDAKHFINPSSPSYDRQYAEDILWHTIAPLTDTPRFNSSWSSQTEQPPFYTPNGPAPKWTPDELVVAFAGDPSLLFRPGGKDHPRAPAYGNRGGAPLYRLAMGVARKYNRAKDKSFIEDLYSNGFIELTKLMKPGYDEARSPFISFVFRNVEYAMEHGTSGSTVQAINARGDVSKGRIEKVDGVVQKERPGEGVAGLQRLLQAKTPEEAMKIANQVKGKFTTGKHHDNDPDNPFGAFSAQIHQLAKAYAEALANNDEAGQSRIRQQIESLDETIAASQEMIPGASTGLGQAVSTPDRLMGDKLTKAIQELKSEYKIDEKNQAQVDALQQKIYEELKKEIVKNKNGEYVFAFPGLTLDAIRAKWTNQVRGVSSIDVSAPEGGGTFADTITGREQDMYGEVDSEQVQRVLEYALKFDVGATLGNIPRFQQMAAEFGLKAGDKIGGKFTANELRWLLRSLGAIGAEYPGKGTMRTAINLPRDKPGWWKPGEDPEMESIPSGGIWHSIWARNGYPEMGGTEIAKEMTEEALEFQKLGIPTARMVKAKAGGVNEVVSKVAVGNTLKSAVIKIKLIAAAENMRESKDAPKLPLLESMDVTDKMIFTETLNWIARKLERTISEDAPPGWSGTVEHMKKGGMGDDKAFAIAWSSYKKGNKSHKEPTKKGDKYVSPREWRKNRKEESSE